MMPGFIIDGHKVYLSPMLHRRLSDYQGYEHKFVTLSSEDELRDILLKLFKDCN
jgi:hypothetical protein